MAKKYLLYIHNPRFDKQEEKSALVNELLDEHYAIQKVGELPRFIETPKTVERLVEAPLARPKGKLCQHGNQKGYCLLKGCYGQSRRK